MRRIIYILAFLFPLLYACQEKEDWNDGVDEGYISLQIGTDTSTSVNRAAEDVYDAKVLTVQILKADGSVLQTISDWNNEETKRSVKLPVGTYSVKAFSAGFDGKTAAMDKPYYEGVTNDIKVAKNAETIAKVTCKLANVKVTVKYDASFMKSFKKASVMIGGLAGSTATLNFVMGETTQSGYFPVKDLYSTVAVTNLSDMTHSQTDTIKGVQARDHYIFTYKVADTGKGSVKIQVDESIRMYTYEFAVPTTPTTTLQVTANAWSNFANLEGSVLSAEKALDFSLMQLQYKLKTATDWTNAATTVDGEICKATAKELSPAADYQCRLNYNEGEFVSEVVDFTTEKQTDLVNGNMDDWYQSGKTWYPASEAYYKENGASFWDSSNPGTTTGAGALVNKNPTQGNTETVHTNGGQSAELKSQYASAVGIGKFAAASLYIGKFNGLVGTKGAKIDFGQPFTSRPTALHGWFQYSTGAMDYVGGNTPSGLGIVEGTTLDECSIYIALTTRTYQVNNTDTSTFVDWNNDPGVVAYGELPAGECVSTNGQWKEFTIPLVYHDLETRPSHIIIVISSSKYGDYFTGSTKSVMYVDDMELIYSDTPQTK